MSSYQPLVNNPSIWASIRRFVEYGCSRVDISYGLKKNNAGRGHLVIKNGVKDERASRFMATGQSAHLGETELGLYAGNACVSYALLISLKNLV